MTDFSPEKLADWCHGVWINGQPTRVNGFCHDSRQITKDDMYIALSGPSFDGHSFVSEAVRLGAGCALIDSDIEASCPVLRVDNTRQALADLAYGHRSEMSAKIVVITGSVGKTSVKEMLADVLSTAGRTSRTSGNWNNDIGLPLSMLKMAAADEFGVFEVGMNHPGELDPLCAILKPGWGIITPIGAVHSEFFNSVEDIAYEKASAVRALPADGAVVLSLDDAWFDLLAENAACRIITTTMSAHVEADYVGFDEGTDLVVWERQNGERSVYPMPLPGRYVKDNALRVIACSREFGLSVNPIANAINNYQPLEMRWTIQVLDGITFVNDAYNANPISMRSALCAFADMPCVGDKWLVLGGMYELGRDERAENLALGREVAYGPWSGLIVVGHLGDVIAEGAEMEGFQQIIRCADVSKAVDVLHDQVREDSCVLLKASRKVYLERILELWDKDKD